MPLATNDEHNMHFPLKLHPRNSAYADLDHVSLSCVSHTTSSRRVFKSIVSEILSLH